MATDIITATGFTNYTLPAHVGDVLVENWAGSGKGNSALFPSGGPGGGGGGYASMLAPIAAGMYVVFVGAANQDTVWDFGGTNVPTAEQGLDGENDGITPGGFGGAGGGGTAGSGGVVHNGGTGAAGAINVGGGGGSGANSTSQGTDGSGFNGGISGGDGGNGGTGGDDQLADGIDGEAPGGGGGGPGAAASGIGAGASGQIRITYTPSGGGGGTAPTGRFVSSQFHPWLN